MMYRNNPLPGCPASEYSFDALLDETCERLLDRQVKYSIQRIYELERRLLNLERELDEFIKSANHHF